MMIKFTFARSYLFLAELCFYLSDALFSDKIQNVYVTLGGSATLTCPLEFPGGVVQPYTVHWLKQGIPNPIYLWREGQQPLVAKDYEGRVALVNSASLSINTITASDPGWYECRIFIQQSGNLETLRNDSWVHLESSDDLYFLEEPNSVTIIPRQEVKLPCKFSLHIPLRWKLNGQFIDTNKQSQLMIEDGHLIIKPENNYNATSSVDGIYQCVAVVGDVALSSRPARVRVAVLQSFEERNDTLEEAPEGGTAIIHCHPPLSIPDGILHLTKDGLPVEISDRVYRLQNGAFKILTVSKTDEGSYRCSFENQLLNLSITASWVVNVKITASEEKTAAKIIISPKKSSIVTLNSNLTLECAAKGFPLPSIKWTKYGGQMPIGRHNKDTGNLHLYNIQKGDEGTYVCEAGNNIGPTDSAYSIVEIQGTPVIAHSFKTQNQTVKEGATVSFQCNNNGMTKPFLEWLHNGIDLISSEKIIFKGTRLILKDVTLSSGGFYQCFISNEMVTVYSTARLLVVPNLVSISANARRDPIGTGLSWSSKPTITLPPSNLTALPGVTVVLPCFLDPTIHATQSWLLNNKIIRFVTHPRFQQAPSGALRISQVKHSDSGLYTCMAIGAHGYNSASAYLTVLDNSSILNGRHDENSEEVTEEIWETTSRYDRQNPRKHKTTNNSKDKMVPPSRPEITKLSDESVMVRWNVPENDGLLISFFKIQYKDVSKSKSRWMTIDDEIAPHIHSFEVAKLKLGHVYRFRIAAVYSNDDNKLGPNSSKFHLQKDPPMKKPIVGPAILHTEAVSPTAILIQWEYIDIEMVPIEGFFIYYRETTSAAAYLKVPVIGANTQSHIISHLLPKVTYEIKMQCFNMAGTSDFSNIVTQSTLDYLTTRNDNEIHHSTSTPVSKSTNELLYMVLSIVLGTILLTVLLFCAYKYYLKHHSSKKRRKYNESLQPSEFELEGLTESKFVNGNMAVVNGHTLSNGYSTGKPVRISINPINQMPSENVIETDTTNHPNDTVEEYCEKNSWNNLDITSQTAIDTSLEENDSVRKSKTEFPAQNSEIPSFSSFKKPTNVEKSDSSAGNALLEKTSHEKKLK